MAASVAADMISGDVTDVKVRIEIAMRNYCEAVEVFIDGLENSGSDYD